MKYLLSLILLVVAGCASMGSHEPSAGQLILERDIGRYQVWWINPDKNTSLFESDAHSCASEHAIEDLKISQVAKGAILGHCLSEKGWIPSVIEEIVVF